MTVRKRVLMVALLTAVALSAHGFGIGLAFGLEPVGGLPGTNAFLSVKPNGSPLLWGLGFTVGSEQVSIGLTGDYWFTNEQLVGVLNYYLGLGFYVGYARMNDENDIQLGGRVPIGLNIFPLSPLELFLELAPTFTQRIADPFKFPDFNFGLQGSLGFRFWSR
ncbi:hypothetical protein Spith_0900 [Spirochaeta thermophila DSM 6578]|uniref:Uncharacterized protein n=1 Tax=Winmispira thermophila (strain ATCC 700085 / DSM 6578 / Z-1203) TaxID=869211 RepID=G0GC89_WINT7|nr:hypothetical protein [Spirochaeta thermophila]AEJ61174.1 hypothetical protein Spith_0900 [Spirochaeta thermophila DSM 6578]